MSHYFSRIRLTAREPDQLMTILKADEYRLHQWLWDLFPDEPDTRRDFLYRRDEQQGWPVFYVLSKRKPETDSEALEIDSKAFGPKLREGDRLAFSLRANPVRTRKNIGEPNKRVRHDVVMDLKKQLQVQDRDLPSKAELIQQAGEEWLVRRAEKYGFAIDAVRVDSYQQHRLKRKKGLVRYSSVDFQGRLMVTAPQSFLRALLHGIGPAKGFGCGLMLVRRIECT